MDLKKKLDIFAKEQFQQMNLEDAVGDRFGRYSKYIIQERAIPDIRDGLKPVQRRILYAMDNLGITSSSTYKKSAKICGEVMGKYHPHGDSSIYEAMVRMSQDWKMGVLLIDMHGNNGSIDGDGPAAMRYTEARLSKNAEYLMQDIEKNTVPFIPNFDEEEMEPTVLPAKFPNLLVNGSSGISSGYATNIPPHNLNEVINATIALIDNENLTIDELLKIMPGPDFPTGGTVQDIEGIREAFLSGNGRVIIRSNYKIEELGKGQKRIVINEIPFDTNKAQTVEKIESLRLQGRIPDVVEVRDESDREGLRIAIDLKKDANEQAILNFLFKNTDLQINYRYNMVSICNRRPMCLGVIPILKAYIDHQKEIVTNRTNFDLQKAKKRLHIVEGLIKMVSILDEVIKTIRASKNRADSKQNIIEKFAFTDLQAEAIITMQLYRLSSTDIMQLQEEEKELNANILLYEKILGSEKELLKVIKKELSDINKTIVIPRRTVIEEEVTDLTIDETDLISKEQVMVSISRGGYVKRVNLKSFNASKNNYLKENDTVLYLKEVSTLDTMLMFTTLGNFIYLPVYKIPECKMKDSGTFINSIVQIDPKENLISCYDIDNFTADKTVLLITNQGNIKQLMLKTFMVNRYTKAVKAMKLTADERLVGTDITDNLLEILTITRFGEALRFRASEVSLRDTTQAGGIRSIVLKPKDEVITALYANRTEDLLLLTAKAQIKRVAIETIPLTRRSRSGNPVIKRLKTNPHQVIDAKIMTPNQYKENVKIYLTYRNGVDELEAFSLKYNVSETGKSFFNEEYDTPISISLNKATKEDEIVSGDYLAETDSNLFNTDIITEEPLRASKPNHTILTDLDKILAENNPDFKTKDEPKLNIGNNDERNLFNSDNALQENVDSDIIKKDKEVTIDGDTVTTKTKSSVIIRKINPKIDD